MRKFKDFLYESVNMFKFYDELEDLIDKYSIESWEHGGYISNSDNGYVTISFLDDVDNNKLKKYIEDLRNGISDKFKKKINFNIDDGNIKITF